MRSRVLLVAIAGSLALAGPAAAHQTQTTVFGPATSAGWLVDEEDAKLRVRGCRLRCATRRPRAVAHLHSAAAACTRAPAGTATAGSVTVPAAPVTVARIVAVPAPPFS